MRSRSRRIATALGVSLCVVATASCSSPAASSELAADGGNGSYLALGDSVPFGSRDGAGNDYEDADNFVGYPQLVGAELGLAVSNAACPGETAVSFQDGGCGYRESYPLHVPYESHDQSQLDFARSFLAERDDVNLVTVQLGANDAFECQRSTRSGCSDAADVAALVQRVQSDLEAILSTLRQTGYAGRIVVVTYYAPDYDDAFGATIEQLDEGIATVAAARGADVADGYEAFRSRAAEAGGDSIAAGLVWPDDVHPTEEGQQLLAEAVLAVVEG